MISPQHALEAAHKQFSAAIRSQVPSRHAHARAVNLRSLHRISESGRSVFQREVTTGVRPRFDCAAASQQKNEKASNTHKPSLVGQPPSVSLIFLPEKRLENAWEKFSKGDF